MTDTTAFPLSWPVGWKRTPVRRSASFNKKTRVAVAGGLSTYRRTESLTVGDGMRRLTVELCRLGASRVVISSNLRRNLDDSITAKQATMLADPGVAVYFHLKQKPMVLACDRWNSAADNMAAIAGHIEAIRTQERYGVGTLDQAFAGYAALPASPRDWWIVLQVTPEATTAQVDDAFRRLARAAHPDVGGSHHEMARINAARDEARKAGK